MARERGRSRREGEMARERGIRKMHGEERE